MLGGAACIGGNVPSVLLVYGTSEEADACCRRLIEDCAKDGGFILKAECKVPWDSRSDTIRAMLKGVEKCNPYH